MQNDQQYVAGQKRKQCSTVDGERENKTPRLEVENQEKAAEVTPGWQAALGSSLAEALEHLTVDRHLTARQVKKLLRAVLTNEDVVSAFRRYINLSEPETGELSAATRRCARNLGLVQPASSSAGYQQQPAPELEPRVITRSLARTIQHSLQDYLPPESVESSRKRCTILDMEFPDDDDVDDDDGDAGSGNEDTLNADEVHTNEPVPESSAGTRTVTTCVDEDYVPGPIDMYILKRDRALDLATCTAGSADLSCSSPRTVSLTDPGSSPTGERSNQSSITDIDYSAVVDLSSMDDCTLDGDNLSETRTSPYMTRFGSRRNERGFTHRTPLDAQGHNVVDQDDDDAAAADGDGPVDDDVDPDNPTEADHTDIKLDEPSAAEEKESSVGSPEEVEDAEDSVYADFLRSLFPSGSSTENTPCKKSHASMANTNSSETPRVRLVTPTNDEIAVGSLGADSETHVATDHVVGREEEEEDADDEDDDDDPEFDVMAELDQVNREDFLDELRDDRAVRVSKMEAKSLHQDLQKLFSDEDEEDEDENGGTTSRGKPHVSAMYAMKSHCHRLLSARRKLEEPDPVNLDRNRALAAAAASGAETSAASEREPSACHVESAQPKFPPSELPRLQRQLGMHIQLLTTSFLCTYDFPHLHQPVTRPSASALKQLTSRRDAFDLLAQQHHAAASASNEPRQQPVRSFYWSCASLDEAVHLISDYAGLSMLPQLSFCHRNLSFRHESSKSRILSSLPLPYCLIRLMVRNPIWSYACLMPSTLPPAEEFEDLLSRSRRRIGIHPTEDALLLFGLADFHDARFPGYMGPIGLADQEEREFGSHPGQHIAYRLVRKHLLPFRTMLQLRARRWNLVASRIGPKPLALPTQRLIDLFRNLSKQRSLKYTLLNELTHDLAEHAVPYHTPLRTGCLADMDASDLFNESGLPSEVGYEAVILNKPTVSRVRKGAYSKLIHDIITDFVQQAQCLWWSRSAPETQPQKSAVLVNASSPAQPRISTSTTALPYTVTSSHSMVSPMESLVLKSEELEASLARQDRNVLGPTFLPAIPVELGPNGHVILSKKAEPAVVEVEAETGIPRPTALVTPVTMSKQSQRVPGSEQSDSTLSINAHVESLLRQIRSQVGKAVPLPKRRCASGLHPQTLRELSSGSPVSGKLPLPPLTSRKVQDEPYLRTLRPLACAPQPAITTPPQLSVVVAVSTNNDVSKSSNPVVDVNSLSPEPVRVSPRTGTALVSCQNAVDSLIEMFHSGLDKALSLHGEALFGPRKFDQLPKPSPQHQYSSYESNKSNTQSSFPNQSNQIDCGLLTPAIAFFSNTSILTASRFLSRCKARGEATSADLLTLSSSIASQRQPVLDELDVRRARSFLDRCRVYLDAQTYGFLVLALRNLNQIVYQHTLQSLDLPALTPAQRRRKILNGLSNVLDLLKGHRPLWEDFVCLLTPAQARTMGLLTAYWNLSRVGRVQRVMLDLVPRGKRFWRRLRNLADSCSPDEQFIPVAQTLKAAHTTAAPTTAQEDFTQTTPASENTTTTTVVGAPGAKRTQKQQTRLSRIRSKGARVRSPITKTWAFLESTWRNRPILLSQQACLLNVNHKPYSGFEQGFEEIDTLARNPLGQADFIQPGQSVLDEGWEVCTELSAAARHRGGVGLSSAPSRHCPCPCHPTSAAVSAAANPTGKPAKADSLGLRHCISCSLRVHRGIVYVDECNFHLRHVQITWPPDFRPKAQLLPSNVSLTRAPQSTDHTYSSRLTTTTTTTTATTTTHTANTRILISQLAETHAASGLSQEHPLPDFAHHRVSIEFIAPCKRTRSCSTSVESIVPFSPVADYRGDVIRPEKKEDQRFTEEDEEVSVGSAPAEPLSPVDMMQSPGTGSDTGRLRSPSNWLMDDDEAACFNTEAFACKTIDSYHGTLSPPTSESPSAAPWDAEEDRQLLEFSKARGRYSSAMFHDLARCWQPKPDDCSPRRTAAELEARFKRLMRVMLGDAYDSDLFCSPDRESSGDEAMQVFEEHHYPDEEV